MKAGLANRNVSPSVFVTLSCTFRYGRDDMDVMGIAFRRELYLSTRQVFPPLQDRDKSVHSKIQAKLLRKLGEHAYPFFFEVSSEEVGGRRLFASPANRFVSPQFPDNLPCSVALQPAPHDVGKVKPRGGHVRKVKGGWTVTLLVSAAMCRRVRDQSLQCREPRRQSSQEVKSSDRSASSSSV